MRWTPSRPHHNLKEWHPWFVGFFQRPVTLLNGEHAWFEHVERRLVRDWYACGHLQRLGIPVIRVPRTLTNEQLRDFLVSLCEARFALLRKDEGDFNKLSEVDKAICVALQYESVATRQMLKSITFYDPPHSLNQPDAKEVEQ